MMQITVPYQRDSRTRPHVRIYSTNIHYTKEQTLNDVCEHQSYSGLIYCPSPHILSALVLVKLVSLQLQRL